MALQTSLAELKIKQQRLHRAFHELHLTLQDAPSSHALADQFDDVIHDCMGWLVEALETFEDGEQSNTNIDWERARYAVTTSQERFNRITHHVADDLISYHRLDALKSLRHKKPDTWRKWVGSANKGLAGCRQALYDVNQALFVCWQDVSERAVMNAISVQTHNVGQQIVRGAAQPNEMMFASEGEHR